VSIVFLLSVIFIVCAPLHADRNDDAFHRHLGVPGFIHIDEHGQLNGKKNAGSIIHLQRQRLYAMLRGGDAAQNDAYFRYCLNEASDAEDHRLEECWDKDTGREDLWFFRPDTTLPTHFYLFTNGGKHCIDVYLTH
jgi:hypothetical protein